MAIRRATRLREPVRFLPSFAAITATVLSAVPAVAAGVQAGCGSRMINVEHRNYAATLQSDAASRLLCLRDGSTVIRLAVRRASITAVLSALLPADKVSYPPSLALDEEINGIYAGPLDRVIARVLDGYDYVIKHENSDIEVVIFDKKGQQAVPPPATAEDTPRRQPAQVSRNR
jgi:hypothetical protein